MRGVDAAPVGDVFVSVTGNRDAVNGEMFERMKSGAIVCNAGHFDVEVNKGELDAITWGELSVRVGVFAAGLRELGVARGDRVGITYLYRGCGRCEECAAGRPELCAKQVHTGYDVDGAFGELAVAHAAHVARVPAGIDAVTAAPLCCAGWTAYRAVKNAGLQPGEWLAVFGVGGLGQPTQNPPVNCPGSIPSRLSVYSIIASKRESGTGSLRRSHFRHQR